MAQRKGFLEWLLGLFGYKPQFTVDDAETFRAALPSGVDQAAYVQGAIALMRVKGIENVVSATAADKIDQKTALALDREKSKERVKGEADNRIAELQKQIMAIKEEADERTIALLNEMEDYLAEKDAAAQAKALFDLAA